MPFSQSAGIGLVVARIFQNLHYLITGQADVSGKPTGKHFKPCIGESGFAGRRALHQRIITGGKLPQINRLAAGKNVHAPQCIPHPQRVCLHGRTQVHLGAGVLDLGFVGVKVQVRFIHKHLHIFADFCQDPSRRSPLGRSSGFGKDPVDQEPGHIRIHNHMTCFLYPCGQCLYVIQ